MTQLLYRGWIKNIWRKEDADERIIKLQFHFILILSVIIVILGAGWLTSPSRLTVYIPPNMQNGSTIKIGAIPEPLIYSFVYEVWQEINYWPNDGAVEYQNNIITYGNYLTSQFKSVLEDEYKELKTSGQIQRIRYMQGTSGAAYDAQNVRQINHDTWQVDLRMRVTEYKNNQIVKDVDILYPLKVTRINVSQHNNPYGLAIAGFISEPKRMQIYI